MITIRTAGTADIELLYNLTADESHVQDKGYFERCLAEQAEGSREVFVVLQDGEIAGYCQYQRKPRYQPFRSLNIPEIQDLYVHPKERQQGFASRLVQYCIDKAINEGHELIGLGVGLHSNYGKAQRLYVKMGFAPDGAGAVYERQGVIPGQLYKVDDELCLMMIKSLK